MKSCYTFVCAFLIGASSYKIKSHKSLTWQHPCLPLLAHTKQNTINDHWYASFPTIGLTKSHRPVRYPFLPHFFTLHDLAPHQGKNITLVVIDTELDDTKHHEPIHTAHKHAAHIQALLKELCPQATIIFINAFEAGLCTKALLIKAVQKAHDIQPDILVLPLKLDDTTKADTPASQILNNLLATFPYVIAAAGNGGTTTLAYPARLSSVTLSAGAFGITRHRSHDSLGTCFIPPFSQYEEKKGPTFLLPGVNIAHHTGTSSATAILAGFLALMLAENNKNQFLSKNQLITLLTTCTVAPSDDEEWTTHALHGVPDMRTSLLILQAFKKSSKKFLTMSSKKFNRLLVRTYKGLLHAVNNESKNLKSTSSFSSNLIPYISSINLSTQITKSHPLCSVFSHMSTEDAITYTKQFVQRRQVIPRLTKARAAQEAGART